MFGDGGGARSFAVPQLAAGRDLSALRRNPLVPAGAALTAGVLLRGLVAFHRGNARLSQRMMRLRVVAQGATLVALAASAAAAAPRAAP